MTKTETAKILAKQYAELEELKDKHYDNIRKYRGTDELDELEYARKKFNEYNSNLATIRETAKLLKISDNTWYRAITDTYLENGIMKRKELA